MSENLGDSNLPNLRDLIRRCSDASVTLACAREEFALTLTKLLESEIPDFDASYYEDHYGNECIHVRAPSCVSGSIGLSTLIWHVFDSRGLSSGYGAMWYIPIRFHDDPHISPSRAAKIEHILKSHLCAREQEEAEEDE